MELKPTPLSLHVYHAIMRQHPDTELTPIRSHRAACPVVFHRELHWLETTLYEVTKPEGFLLLQELANEEGLEPVEALAIPGLPGFKDENLFHVLQSSAPGS